MYKSFIIFLHRDVAYFLKIYIDTLENVLFLKFHLLSVIGGYLYINVFFKIFEFSKLAKFLSGLIMYL